MPVLPRESVQASGRVLQAPSAVRMHSGDERPNKFLAGRNFLFVLVPLLLAAQQRLCPLRVVSPDYAVALRLYVLLLVPVLVPEGADGKARPAPLSGSA